jgi:hypothetical protein
VGLRDFSALSDRADNALAPKQGGAYAGPVDKDRLKSIPAAIK